MPATAKATARKAPNTEDAAPVGLGAKLRRGDLLAPDCPSREVLKHITSRWGVLILVVLLDGTARFSDLKRAVGGVNERMLAQTLQWLEGDGLVLRTAYPVVPPHVEYSLTPMGLEAARKVEALADWIEVKLPQIMRLQARAAQVAEAATAPVPGVVRHRMR